MTKTYTPNTALIEPFDVDESSETEGKGLDFGNFLHLNEATNAVKEAQRRLGVLQEALPNEFHWMTDVARDLQRKQQELRRIERDIAEGIKIY